MSGRWTVKLGCGHLIDGLTQPQVLAILGKDERACSSCGATTTPTGEVKRGGSSWSASRNRLDRAVAQTAPHTPRMVTSPTGLRWFSVPGGNVVGWCTICDGRRKPANPPWNHVTREALDKRWVEHVPQPRHQRNAGVVSDTTLAASAAIESLARERRSRPPRR